MAADVGETTFQRHRGRVVPPTSAHRRFNGLRHKASTGISLGEGGSFLGGKKSPGASSDFETERLGMRSDVDIFRRSGNGRVTGKIVHATGTKSAQERTAPEKSDPMPPLYKFEFP